MFKLLLIIAWALFAADVVIAIGGFASNKGGDAAGRGMASALGLVAVVCLLMGGAALFFSGRAHSWLGVIASCLPMAIPLAIIFGSDVHSAFHNLGVWNSNRKVGQYPEPAQRELAKAIEAGDLPSLRRILATHPNLNGHDEAGIDLLRYAVMQINGETPDGTYESRVEAVRLLLEAGMDPNQSKDIYGGSTFAGLASQVGNRASAETFRVFLEHGANPDVLGTYRQALLFHVWENVDSLRLLLDHGANINIRDDAGNTPLLYFVWNGRWDAALLMLERGADLQVQNKEGMTVDLSLDNGPKERSERLKEPLPDGYHRFKTALQHRREEESRGKPGK